MYSSILKSKRVVRDRKKMHQERCHTPKQKGFKSMIVQQFYEKMKAFSKCDTNMQGS